MTVKPRLPDPPKPITHGLPKYGPWPTTKAKAIELDTKTFFPGTACKNSHITTRLVSGGGCSICRSAAKKQKYQDEDERIRNRQKAKECRINNPDRHRARNRESARRRYHADPEKFIAQAKEWRAENPDVARSSAKSWRDKNPERVQWQNQKWPKENPEARRAIHSRRKARKLGDSGPPYSGADVKELLKKQGGKCAYCAVRLKGKYHVDHVMPLALGGSNSKSNIQITCPDCNLKKHALHPIDFAHKIGLLC